MESFRERLRKSHRYALVGAAVVAWTVALRWSGASSEWTGFWSSDPPTRGKVVETEAERKKRMARQDSELRATISDMRKDMLGDRRPTRGDDPGAWDRRPSVPGDVAGYTQRDVCFQMKLEFPDRFGDVDCMSKDYDDTDPWFRATNKPGR